MQITAELTNVYGGGEVVSRQLVDVPSSKTADIAEVLGCAEQPAPVGVFGTPDFRDPVCVPKAWHTSGVRRLEAKPSRVFTFDEIAKHTGPWRRVTQAEKW